MFGERIQAVLFLIWMCSGSIKWANGQPPPPNEGGAGGEMTNGQSPPPDEGDAGGEMTDGQSPPPNEGGAGGEMTDGQSPPQDQGDADGGMTDGEVPRIDQMDQSGQNVYNVTVGQSLFENLTTGYNKLLQPSRPVNVGIYFTILSVNSLDVKEQVLSITGYMTAEWYDSRLRWDFADYSYVLYMFFTDAYIWRPELVIQNSAIGIPIVDNDELFLRVNHSGNVTWIPPGAYIVSCDVDITFYPFDTQTCSITVSTWSHDDTVISLFYSLRNSNIQDYEENGEWDLINNYLGPTLKSVRNPAGLTRSSLQFYFVLKRKTPFYVINVILPPLLTSLLGLMVFLLPAESGEKVGFSITVLLALAVLLTMATDFIPSTSKNTSLYSTYLLSNLFISGLEVFVTVLVLRLHHNHDRDKPVPGYIQKIANIFLARTSCFKPCVSWKTGRQHTDIENITKRSQISPEKVEEVAKATGDSWTEYTWAEVAIMVDNTSFAVIFVLWIGMAVGFNMALSNN